MAGADGRPIGILAGGGSLPFEIAADLQQRGIAVHIVGIDGFVGSGVASFPHTIIGLGQLGGMLAALRDTGCREMVIVGALERPDLRRLRFDLGALRHLPAVLSLTRGGDDSLLRRIVRFFEGQGLIVRGIGEVAPGLLAPAGRIAGPTPCPRLEAAIGRARAALADLSRFDIGQAAVARPDGLVAVEAAEGTRRMLARLAAAGGAGADAVLVKLPKLDQEMRIDLPAIGAGTVAEAQAAGLAAIAVAAGAAVLVEREALVRSADAARMGVVGLRPGEPIDTTRRQTVVTAPTAGARDMAAALALCRTVLRHARPATADVVAVVRDEHALVVEIDGLMRDGAAERLERLPRGWGLPRLGRTGALAVAIGEGGLVPEASRAIAALVPGVRRAGLAALVVELGQRDGNHLSPEVAARTRDIETAARRAGLIASVTTAPGDQEVR